MREIRINFEEKKGRNFPYSIHFKAFKSTAGEQQPIHEKVRTVVSQGYKFFRISRKRILPGVTAKFTK